MSRYKITEVNVKQMIVGGWLHNLQASSWAFHIQLCIKRITTAAEFKVGIDSINLYSQCANHAQHAPTKRVWEYAPRKGLKICAPEIKSGSIFDGRSCERSWWVASHPIHPLWISPCNMLLFRHGSRDRYHRDACFPG